jgi:hypothetical protein
MRYHLLQVFKASSRLLNALTGGEGDCTFSAWSYHLWVDKGSSWGKWRVWALDCLLGEHHCKHSYEWHVHKDLLTKEDLF